MYHPLPSYQPATLYSLHPVTKRSKCGKSQRGKYQRRYDYTHFHALVLCGDTEYLFSSIQILREIICRTPWMGSYGSSPSRWCNICILFKRSFDSSMEYEYKGMQSMFGYAASLFVAATIYSIVFCRSLQVELRDHDHTVECIAWAGENASQAINEAAGTDNKTGSHHGPFLASGSRDKSIRVRTHLNEASQTIDGRWLETLPHVGFSFVSLRCGISALAFAYSPCPATIIGYEELFSIRAVNI